ncbi:MAG: PSD1 and planctomycete cytochrome C domain-containing protein [Pirellulaceae bacterium]|nr:PSD1 and planctomycete cytochrome C domain-containing protein [Pirellulaceae bacterium]
MATNGTRGGASETVRSQARAWERAFSRWRSARSVVISLLLYTAFAAVFGTSLLAIEKSDEGVAFFESKVRPILVEHCYECHSLEAGEANGELRVDSRDAMLKGGTRGTVIRASTPDRSLLIQAIEYHDAEIKMPPEGRIPEQQISILRKWIEMGAPDPRDDDSSPTVANSIADKLAKASGHWAYLPPKSISPDRLSGVTEDWIRDPIDAIVVAIQAENELKHSPDADRRTLIRRLYYDLLGLPPSIEEIAQWSKTKDSDWYEKLVQSLLESPHFGERLARRWMDVTRYADNKGYVFKEEREYPNAYRYRDWLVRSFNEDLAYEDFLRYQLIGDRLDPENKAGHLDAMGMLTLGRRFLQNKNDIIDDRIDVVSRGLLGITASCARCHDHKFDPVTTADYYSLHGMFSDTDEPGDGPSSMRLVDKSEPSKTYVFLRGNPGTPGPEVARRFFDFLESDGAHRPLKTGSGRLEMAEAIVEPKNPLTARVYVNRVWGWLTGRPLVDTPSDFGLRCDPPIYQEILDDLSVRFVENGWSTKKLVQRIVLSSTYRQSSLSKAKLFERDPENQLLWRANRKRMDFESYRDAVLMVTGNLDVAIGGKSEVIHIAPFSKRRTVYAYIDRQNLPQFFRSFDFASPDAHVPQRAQTTVPQQSLTLMNSEMMAAPVKPLAESIEWSGKQMPSGFDEKKIAAKQVGLIFRKLLAREPSTDETTRFAKFMQQADTSQVTSAENCWSYGYGKLDLQANQIASFERLPRFENGSWSGMKGPPDSELGWTTVSEKGGHPGKSLDYCCVRRWTAPRNGRLAIRGTIEHASEEGDGVRASIFHNLEQAMGTWTAKHGKASTTVKSLEVKEADIVDFVVDCIENEGFDTFTWPVVLSFEDSPEKYDSKEDFSSMQPTLSTPIQQAIQALLMTNEFCFVD